MMADLTIVQDKEGEYTGPRHALVQGVRIPFYEPNIDKNFEKDLTRFETRPDDVFVLSYPKSGRSKCLKPKPPKISANNQSLRKSHISLEKVLNNRWYQAKVLPKTFHWNGYIIGFR